MQLNMIEIVGTKVTLRDLTEKDVQLMYYWNYEAEDREHIKWNGPYYPRPEKTLEQFVEDHKNDLLKVGTDQPRKVLVIEVNGKLVGTVGWYWEDECTNWLSNGIVIYDSNYWSGGYGTEAFSLWTDYIFEHMDVVRVGISTWSGNERMIALASKMGMSMEGRIRKARIVDGEYFDSVKMGMLREEWEALKRGTRN
ncbi:GNAT family N-acetyltransferase [Chengkuizengella axinellae]|uniref:GNAT family protein n=1 Tax=Chengkuizengella axinellae TaxID=3064388 RepID=A0ABT9IW25_9BACL|nr:GNAT family protein [Chengkuizengella sp. 2205SS18-9]MDP5273574.1 GNAT family protein [Chengkuizengella sp. 2205SS18-9]